MVETADFFIPLEIGRGLNLSASKVIFIEFNLGTSFIAIYASAISNGTYVLVSKKLYHTLQ